MDKRKLPDILEERLDIEKIRAWYREWEKCDGTKQSIVNINSQYSQDGYYKEPNIQIPQLTDQYGAIVRLVYSKSDPSSGVGSGFFVRPDILVTAYHAVINDDPNLNAEGILTKNGKFISLSESKVTKLNYPDFDDPDLAIVEFQNNVHDQVLELSNEKPISFQEAVMAGYPYRIPLSEGIMTSFGSSFDFTHGVVTNIPAEQGHSGSPVFSLDGKVIGMHIKSLDRVMEFELGSLHKKAIPAYNILQALNEYQSPSQ